MKIRFGIMGPGGIAKKFANALNSCEQAELYAVASRNKEKADTFAENFGAKVAYGSYEELVKDENVDIVYISVIHPFHVDLAKLAINNGKSIICEKPLTISVAECTELVDLAREKNVLLMEALWSRFLPTYKKAKEWLETGKIGEARLFNANFAFQANFNPNGRLFDAKNAGGGLFDVGCYTIAAALDFCGGKKPLLAKGVATFGKTNVDELAAASLVFDNGMIAALSFGIRVSTEHGAYIYGTDGKIVMNHFWDGGNVELYNKAGELVETFADDTPNGFVYEIAHICNLFKEGKKESPIMSLQHSLDCMDVMETLLCDFEIDNSEQFDIAKLDI